MVQSPFKLLRQDTGCAVIKKSYDGIQGFDGTVPLDLAIGDYDFVCAEIERAASLPYKHRSKVEMIGREDLQAAGKLWRDDLIEHRNFEIIGASGLEALSTLEVSCNLNGERTHAKFYLRLASPENLYGLIGTITRYFDLKGKASYDLFWGGV